MDSREERSHGGPPGLPKSHDWIESWIYIYSFSTCVCSFKCFMLSFIFGFVMMEACLCVGPLKEAVATAAAVVCHCCLVMYDVMLRWYWLWEQDIVAVICSLMIAFRFVSVMVTIRFVSFMLEAMLSTGYLLFIFPKIIKLNILMEETICKSCILAFMNATCTVCMINIVIKCAETCRSFIQTWADDLWLPILSIAVWRIKNRNGACPRQGPDSCMTHLISWLFIHGFFKKRKFSVPCSSLVLLSDVQNIRWCWFNPVQSSSL